MKKTFQIIGLISLTCFSFFATEKTATVVNNMDEIMVQIKGNSNEYKSNPIDAIIDNSTIISGVRGKKVNINKSYKSMKKNGYYSDKLFVYDYTKPNISIEDNMDKYIIKGNSSKRMISLIFKLTGETNINPILNILNNYNIKSTFFIDYNWFINNNELMNSMVKKGHNFGILLDNYEDSEFEWMDIVIRNVNKQKNNFCYGVYDNDLNLKICKDRKSYTLRPIEISNTTPFLDIKNKLDSGIMLSFNVSSELRKELSTIIIYIKSKGFNIANIDENILE